MSDDDIKVVKYLMNFILLCRIKAKLERLFISEKREVSFKVCTFNSSLRMSINARASKKERKREFKE